ncbi:MAG: hypothetical protein JXA41_04940 [Deltaproteobacteria bacterium]|nr:hypothetical protein [Deltaproteobacteria bacterium]
MKVLLIDERPDTLDFLGESMVKQGYKTGIAKDKKDIFSMLSENQYDVILANGVTKELDIDKDIRSRYDSIYIVYLSADDKKNEHQHAGVDMYLHRPFVASDLRQAIKKPFTH